MNWQCVVLATLTCFACELPDNRPADHVPGYADLFPLRGVNLPHLSQSGGLTEDFLANSAFEKNLAAMKWNAYRVPISWSDFSDGKLGFDSGKTQRGRKTLEKLIHSLKRVRNGAGIKRVFMVLDFHQFRFGPVCAGDGVPKSYFETKLSPSDPNCVFTAFDRFWKNERGVQDGWIDFAAEMIESLPRWASEEAEWLTIGVELMNEPMAGSSQPLFVADNYQSYLRFRQFFQRDQAAQIEGRLIPFHQKFLERLIEIPGFDLILKRALFVVDPFVLDHMVLNVTLMGFHLTLTSDGSYSGFTRLTQVMEQPDWRVHFIGSPHHYDGAQDDSFFNFLPPQLLDVLIRYPNETFSQKTVYERMEHQRARMAEAGMDLFIGEFGTQRGLLTADGKPGGYNAWIADSWGAIAKSTKGGLWWRYSQDPTLAQDSYYLLRGLDLASQQLDSDAQILKCDPFGDWVRRVFGTCPIP